MLEVAQAQFPLPFPMNTSIWPPHGLMFGNFGSLGADAAAAWPTANAAFYYPFRLPFRMSISAITVLNGGTVSGNIDGAIYNGDGVRLTSTGSTAQTGTNTSQTLNFTDVTIGPGLYFAGIAMDNTTGQLFRWTNIPVNGMGIFQQATAFPLPATATLTFNSAAAAYIANFIISGTRLHDESVIGWPMLPTINAHSQEASGPVLIGAGTGAMYGSASAAWPLANGAFLFPFVLTERTRIRRLWCFNGTTVSGNIDLGIYAGNHSVPMKLVSSGSVAQAGTDVVQSAAVDITLGPGRYLFALACDNTTAQFRRLVAAAANFLTPAAYQFNASSFPLGTLGSSNSQNYVPLCGLSRYA